MGSIGQEVETRTDVLVGSGGDELESESVAAGGDTVSARVVGTVKSAVGGTGLGVGAKSRVPSVTGVTVGVAAKKRDARLDRLLGMNV